MATPAKKVTPKKKTSSKAATARVPKKTTTRTAAVKTTKAAKTKKTTIKKKVAAKKAPAKETATGKTTPKKPTATRKAKATKKPRTAQPSDTVTLPNRMPMRAQEKTLAWTQRMVDELHPAMVTVSRVAAVCFVLLGGTVSLTAIYGSPSIDCGASCSAQVASAVRSPAVVPTITVLGSVPSRINSTVSVPLQVPAATDVLATLQVADSAAGQQIIPLKTTALGNDKYSIEIRGEVLQSGTYTLKTQVRFSTTGRYQTFTIGTFKAGAPTTASSELPVTVEPDAEVRPATAAADSAGALTISTARQASKTIAIRTVVTGNYDSVDFFVRNVSGVNTQFVGTLHQGDTTFYLNT